MAAPRKIALWSLALAALAVGLALLASHLLIDEARLKAWLQQHARTNWQRELSIDRLSWAVLPRLALRGEGVSLSNPQWAHEKAMLTAGKLEVQLEWLPLLSKRIVADRLLLTDFQVALEEDQEGRSSWSLPAPPKEAPPPERSLASVVQFRELAVRKGSVGFRNRAGQDKRWDVEHAELKSAPGWRNVRFHAELRRDGAVLQAHGKLDDASQIGETSAATPGMLEVKAGPASLRAEGLLPLSSAPQRYAFDLTADAPSLEQALPFLPLATLPRAPLKASLRAKMGDQVLELSGLDLTLGKMHLSGDARIDRHDAARESELRMDIDRFDWVQVRHDLGLPALAPKKKGELFFEDPLPWTRLAQARGRGHIEAKIGFLKTRSGMELTDVSFDAALTGHQLEVTKLSGQLAGGSVNASAVLDGSKQVARIKLDVRNAQLGSWLVQTGKKVSMSGARLQLRGDFVSSGPTQKAMAASLTGPVAIELGNATLHSKKLGEAEVLLIGLSPFLSAKDTDHVDLRCASAYLPFQDGVARGENIIGLRSEASQILAGGSIDLKRQRLDLHGSIRARAGITLGISTVADKLKMEGKIAAPQVSLDKSNAPKTLAHMAAALLTGGASLVGTAIWDGVQSVPNPCEQVSANMPPKARLRATSAAHHPG